MTILVKNKHTLEIDEFKFRCCIGKKGSTKNKKEGDKKTPKGNFEIEKLYFRKDRKEKPSTLLKCVEITKDMGWCHDVNFPKKYNKLFKIKNNEIELLDHFDSNFEATPVVHDKRIYIASTDGYLYCLGQ